ncbi:2-oxo acid dehydrogenase subunit E2 [Lichenibacterium dinghuense]|uniref:2-oxo acid dehydrogenase subunit E2 n=1 Tax=Lichenibacterium dinghuense TaxID=2895977 RepID=UPI001F01F387|nr:2-oxo acid dehydrogenase subunit E2 [Lichenibacterium sp. 6Y81]
MTATAPIDEGRAVPLSKTARTMAKYMSQAWTAPMFGLTAEVDMTAANARRAQLKGEGVTLTDVIVQSCVRAIKAHPKLNAHFRDDAVVFYDDVNVGLAVANDKGLIVPVIHGAQELSLSEIGARRRELIGKTRTGGLKVPDVTGGTFTVSNLGMFDVTRFTAIINPPQVAILAVGSTVHRQVWNGGEPAWRPVAEFTLTSDHRAVDGAAAAGFLQALKKDLEAGDGAA